MDRAKCIRRDLKVIKGYIGLLGQGKTISMINDAIPLLERGYNVLTNVPFSWNYKGKILQPEYMSNAQEFQQKLFTAVNTLVIVDEASIVWSNYDWDKMPVELIMKFAQSRKYGLHFFYTTQGLNHTVKRLRDLTNYVVRCERIDTFGVRLIRNIVYNPEFFDFMMTPPLEMEKKYIIKRRILTPLRLKKLYKSYNTYHRVSFNVLNEGDIADQQNEIKIIEIPESLLI